MILVKQAGVYVNILNCKLKKYLAEVFKKNNVNLTAEQYLVMDTLWNIQNKLPGMFQIQYLLHI